MNKEGGVKLPSLEKLAEAGREERIKENTAPISQGDQVKELIHTVKVRLGPSGVHGVGVIAIRDLKAGEQLFCSLTVKPRWYNVTYTNLSKHLDKTFPEIKQLILDRWPNVVNGASFLSPNYDARLISFMNHSDTPNYDPRTDCALVDIAKGEEVFEDYKVVQNWQKAFPWLVE